MNLKNMDKTTIVNTFMTQVDNLRNNAKCSQKEKIACFQQIAECIMSPAMESHINYATHCSTATNVLLLFCEDLDSACRMSAEENLNRIFRFLERTRVSRILMDLYGEIKRNGNQRSLRICLNLFAYYAPRIKEKYVQWYALRLLHCLQTIAQRKETQLSECLCEFVKNFGKNLQHGLTDSETCRLFETFIANIGVDCAVKRRCSAQNCISLIENSRNKSLMAKHGLNKVIELLLKSQEPHSILGALGFLRLLLPLIIRGFPNDILDDDDDVDDTNEIRKQTQTQSKSKTSQGATTSATNTTTTKTSSTPSSFSITKELPQTNATKNKENLNINEITTTTTTTTATTITNECRQIIEIYDYCLHLLSTSNTQQQHGIINASLEVINAILQALDISAFAANTTTTTSMTSSKTTTLTAKTLKELLSNQQLQHNEYLRKRKSLKNQIFQQLKIYEVQYDANNTMTKAMMLKTNVATTSTTASPNVHKSKVKTNQTRQIPGSRNYDEELQSTTLFTESAADVRQNLRHQTARSISECVDDDFMAIAEEAAARTSAQLKSKTRTNSGEGERGGLGSGAGAAASTTLHIIDVDDIVDDIDDDDFTTLSEINEPQQTNLTEQKKRTQQQQEKPTAHIDVENLIDAIDATSINNDGNKNVSKNENEQTKNLLTPIKATIVAGSGGAGVGFGDDKSSQNLSDFDNESFNSIDFEAEITIGGGGGRGSGNVGDGGGVDTDISNSDTTKSSSVAIGSFFNNLISHSSAASESVTKLFRQSSTSKLAAMTPTKSQSQSQTDKSDAASLTSVSATDSLSLISTTSENKRSDIVVAILEESEPSANYTQRRSSSISDSPADMLYDESYSRTGSVTASTAVLNDNCVTRQTTASDCSSNDNGEEYEDDNDEKEPHKMEVEFRRKPNVNPFLVDNSPLKQTITALPQITLKIGTIFEQPLIYYTARCIAARFLLTGDQTNPLQSDATTRVSIKSLSLAVVAQCVRILPEVLQLQLEITAAELRLLAMQLEIPPEIKANSSNNSSASHSPEYPRSEHSDSSYFGMDYEHVVDNNKASSSNEGAIGGGIDVLDFSKSSKTLFPQLSTSSLLDEDNSLLLEIKDDHFGKSTSDHLFNQPLSRSADPVMLAQQVGAPFTSTKQSTTSSMTSTPPPRLPAKNKIDTSILSKSDIVIATNRSKKLNAFKITESSADAPPPMLPPRPPKRTKSIKKSAAEKSEIFQWPTSLFSAADNEVSNNTKGEQCLSDILLFYNHTDPMLRSGIQQIVGNFIQATKAGLTMNLALNLQQLLAILIKGLQDEIHTVIIQALNAFDKIFPHVLSKYLTEPPSCHYQRQQKDATRTAAAQATQTAATKCQVNAPGVSASTTLYEHRTSAQSYCANDMFYVTQGFRLGPTSTYPTRTLLFTDNDELIDALLNTFQLQSNRNDNNDAAGADVDAGNKARGVRVDAESKATSFSQATATTTAMPNFTSADSNSKSKSSNSSSQTNYNRVKCFDFFISPKLLLDKLRLCHNNKYWLVQNKYAEVISNLNYAALRTYYEQNGNANYELSMEDFKHTSNTTTTWMSEADDVVAAASEAEAAATGSNADYATAHSTYPNSSSSLLVDFIASDIVCFYETHFLDDLLQLIGDADARVRAHAAECLCRFVIQNAKQHVPPEQKLQNTTKNNNKNQKADFAATNSSNKQNQSGGGSGGANQKVFSKETFQTNLNLVWDFFDYSIFSGLPQPMRDIFRATASIAPPPSLESPSATAAVGDAMTYATAAMARNFKEEEKVLAKVLYRMTNKLMTLNDKNLQFGIIYTLRALLKHFNFVDFRRAWLEFNFMEICMKFSYYNSTTAVDLNCQCDLIDVTGKLMAGSMLVMSSPIKSQQQFQQQQQLQLQIEKLLTHTIKIINIYYHLFTNQKPLLFVKAQKGDLFANARELAIVQSVGYFGNDFVYIKLYNILRSANDSYKITINPESGTLLMSLLKICLNALSLCLELRSHSLVVTNVNDTITATMTNPTPPPPSPHPTPAVLKLIEEILQYLTKLINYAPSECIACLRQLLKYLFGQNYGNRQPDYFDTLVRAYFAARVKGQQNDENDNNGDGIQTKQEQNEENVENKKHETINSSATATATGAMTMTLSSFGRVQQQQQQKQQISLQRDLIATHGNFAAATILNASTTSPSTSSPVAFSLSSLASLSEQRLFAELFANGLSFHTWHYEREGECVRHIKLFERLVIYCLTLFMKSNAIVQAPILALLSQLLDLNVTYSVLDSKNVIFEQILNNLEIIESGNARNADIIIPPMIKFLVQLTHKSDRKLITIPKIISITNNLLANNTIGDYAVMALKALTYEIFFISQTTITTEMANSVTVNKSNINAGSTVGAAAAVAATMSSITATTAKALSSSSSSSAAAITTTPTSPSHKVLEKLPPRAPFQSPIARSPLSTPQTSLPRQQQQQNIQQHQSQQQRHMVAQETAAAAAIASEALLTQQRELDTQKEVVMGMLEKFIDANVCQQVLCLLLLREQCSAELETILELNADKILRTTRRCIAVTESSPSSSSSGMGMNEDHHGGSGYDVVGSNENTNTNTHNSTTIQSMVSILPDSCAVYATICRAMSDGRIRVRDWNDFFVLNTIFCNYGKSVLADSKEFLTLLQLFITKNITGDFTDLSYATIILENVILRTEEIYLVNHIKLYLKNQPMLMKALQREQAASNLNYDVGLLPLQDGPSTSSGAAAKARAAARITGAGSNTISEIKYFAKVLCDKLDDCLASIVTGSLEQQQQRHQQQLRQRQQRQQHHYHRHHTNKQHYHQQQQFYPDPSHYCQLTVRFVSALYDVCCRSRHKDALQSVFRMILAESNLLDKYYNLLMMGGDNAADIGCGGGGGVGVDAIASYLLLLQFELFKLLSAVKLLDPLVMLQQIQTVPSLKWNVPAYVRQRLLQAIIIPSDDHTKPAEPWQKRRPQQVLELCSDIKSVNFLIADIVDANHRACIYDLCQVDLEFCSLLLSALLQQANMVNKRYLRGLLHLLLRISAGIQSHDDVRVQIEINAKIIATLAALQRFHGTNNVLIKQQLMRAALALFNSVGSDQEKLICESLQRLEIDDQQSYACFLFLNGLQNLHGTTTSADINDAAESTHLEQRIIDEKWLFAQLIKFSTQPDCDPQQLVKILLEIQSENKLQKIFENEKFDVSRVLPHAITGSVEAMLSTFRNNCIQHNPHIHYMRPNPLARVTNTVLMARIEMAAPAASHAWDFSHIPDEVADVDVEVETGKEQKDEEKSSGATATSSASVTMKKSNSTKLTYLAKAVIALMESVEHIEATALVYIEAKFIEKFVREQILQAEQLTTLLRYLSWSCMRAQELLQKQQQQQLQLQKALTPHEWSELRLLMLSIGKMLAQNLIWNELNQFERPTTAEAPKTTSVFGGGAANILTLQQRSMLLCRLLDLLVLASTQTLQHTLFYKRFKVPSTTETSTTTTTTLMMRTMMQSALSDAATVSGSASLSATTEVEEYDDDVAAMAIDALLHAYAPKAIFIAKLIETKIDVDATAGILSAAYITGGGGSSSLRGGNSANSGGMGVGGGATSGGGCNTVCGGSGGVMNLDVDTLQAEFATACAQLPLHLLTSIGISILRTNQFYAYAVTPFEIVQQQEQQRLQSQSFVGTFAAATATGNDATLTPLTTPERRRQKTAAAATLTGKMPTIAVESLSDVDILRKFVKRLSIFGFTTRQQFEEYFMTFLLLINKVYDENMVDEQEQFHIKSNCLEAILELLITYKTFPIVGNKIATRFHHTTRWTRINCDSISLKKLHKVQLLIAEANVFYHPNLERQLSTSLKHPKPDTINGTGEFQPNQYDLNFIWQQMEAYAQPTTISPNESVTGEFGDFSSGSSSTAAATASTIRDEHKKEPQLYTEDNATRNFRYFSKQSGIDFKSSSQLIFDVLMQLVEFNHYLVLPNLVKFTEICESRDQIKCIKDKAFKLQETLPMDDTISHQHLIYLLCKTQAMLIPTHNELQQLCSLISTYLKSSHVFIRNATLQGLICLLECCSKTNTIIGKLSDELSLLRDLILNYINRHGIIDKSPIECSDTHTKLVWTLNYCLIEWTTKFVPQCHLLSNTVIAASNFLRQTNNEEIYLCVLHGLERLVVIGNNGYGMNNSNNTTTPSNTSSNINISTTTDNNNAAGGVVGMVTPLLRHKIEKLALDLVKLENEKFSIPALKLLLSCMYLGSSKQLENTELSNGIVQDDPEIIAQQTDKVDILLHCIKSSTRDAAWIYGQVLCQIIRDLVPPNEILTKVIKEFLAINQPHCDVIAMIVYQVFRCAIDSSFLQMLQDWLICSLPTFLALPVQKGVWGLSVIFLSASINLHLIKLFPVVVAQHNAGLNCGSVAAAASGSSSQSSGNGSGSNASGGLTASSSSSYGAARDQRKLGQHEIALFVTAAQDFHAKLSVEQKMRFRDAFKKFQQHKVYAKMLQSL